MKVCPETCASKAKFEDKFFSQKARMQFISLNQNQSEFRKSYFWQLFKKGYRTLLEYSKKSLPTTTYGLCI